MVLCNKIAEGIDTRYIGESVLLSLNAIHRERSAEFKRDP
ncbi:hypothetical protein LEP1GSC041_2241 [Leptospira noguchii str. 2006001870]|nr:hypothetical protein LEP1GSC041_2241 [Leptospira noguchii str. 2006001870]